MSLAIIAADCEGGPDDAVDDDELLDVRPCWERETLDDDSIGRGAKRRTTRTSATSD